MFHNIWPEQFRINDIAEYLSKKGYEVDVLTGIPNYPQGEINKDFKINKKNIQISKEQKFIEFQFG